MARAVLVWAWVGVWSCAGSQRLDSLVPSSGPVASTPPTVEPTPAKLHGADCDADRQRCDEVCTRELESRPYWVEKYDRCAADCDKGRKVCCAKFGACSKAHEP